MIKLLFVVSVVSFVAGALYGRYLRDRILRAYEKALQNERDLMNSAKNDYLLAKAAVQKEIAAFKAKL